MNPPLYLAKAGLVSLLFVIFPAAASQLPQTIEWSSPSTSRVLLLNQFYPLAATSSGGLPVSFRVESGPAYLQDDAITATNIGSIVVAAEQAGNANYAAARQSRLFNPLAAYLEKVGEWPGFPQGPLNDLKVIGTKVYAALEASRLAVFDVADPANPVRLGSYVFDSVVETPRLDVAGSRVYVAGGRFGLRIVDMTDPARPVLLASDPFRTVLGLQVTGTLLWLVDGANLRAFDVARRLLVIRSR